MLIGSLGDFDLHEKCRNACLFWEVQIFTLLNISLAC